jgi:hypothetical protein
LKRNSDAQYEDTGTERVNSPPLPKEVINVNSISDLLGKTVVDITQVLNDELIFKTNCGRAYKMYHYQDCCECVEIEET